MQSAKSPKAIYNDSEVHGLQPMLSANRGSMTTAAVCRLQ